MKRLFILATLLLFMLSAYSQSFFSNIYDTGGDEGEGKFFNIIQTEDDIKIIGALHDSVVPGFEGGTWPILSTLTYNGEYLNTKYLFDSLYSDGFYYFSRRLAFKNDSICYIFDRRDIGNVYLDCYLAELNIRTGNIIKSKIIKDLISDHETFLATDITTGINGDIFLINVTEEFGPHPQILTVLDSNMELKSQTFIPSYGRSNITKFTEIDSVGNITLIGVSLGMPNNIWFHSKLFRQTLDSNYNSTSFTLAPTIHEQSITSYEHYTVIRSDSGDWVVAAQVVLPTSDCADCFISVPYVVSIAPDFSNVNWETRMFSGTIESSNPRLTVQSITNVEDGFVFAGYSDGMAGIETSGFLGKVSLNGDSLWLKQYIPVGWDSTQARWFHLADIKTTPTGSILVCGFASNSYTSSIVPWLLHLDKEGCIEPGCNITSTKLETEPQSSSMLVFPNPVRTGCNVSIYLADFTTGKYTFRVINALGQIMLNQEVLTENSNLLLDLNNLPQGYYFAQITQDQFVKISKEFVVIH